MSQRCGWACFSTARSYEFALLLGLSDENSCAHYSPDFAANCAGEGVVRTGHGDRLQLRHGPRGLPYLIAATKALPVNKPSRLDARCLGDALFVLRIEKVTDGRSTVLKLSGRIDEEHVTQLCSEIEKSGDASKLDLRDVNLVDRSAVRFLIQCESQGIQLANCPLYIREWISKERRRAVSRADSE